MNRNAERTALRAPGEIQVDDILHQIVVTLAPRIDVAEVDSYRGRIIEVLSQHLITATSLPGIDPLKILGFTIHSRGATFPVEEAMAVLNEEAWIERVERNHVIGLLAVDPLYPQQWALERISAPRAWKREGDAGPVRVAIVDSGVATNHFDLLAHLVTGWNVIYPPPPPPEEEDHDGHGTQLAGTIGAISYNAIGIAAAGWPIELMAVKFHDIRNRPNALWAATAIFLAYVKGAKVINASWHLPGSIPGPPPGFLDFVIAYVWQNGVTVVAAAGNDGTDNDLLPTYPASYLNVISVMATKERDGKAGFSNYGENSVHLAAPGVHVLSTDVSFGTQPSRWRQYSGTSVACAHVTAAAAFLKALNPQWGPEEIRAHLIASVDRMPTWPSPHLKCQAHGRLNLERAVCGPLAVTSPFSPPTVNWFHGSTVTVTWKVTYYTPLCTSVRIELDQGAGLHVLKSGISVPSAGPWPFVMTSPPLLVPLTAGPGVVRVVSEQGPGLFDEVQVTVV